MSRQNKLRMLLMAVTLLGLIGVTAWLVWPRIEVWAASYHQKKVAGVFQTWGESYSIVTNKASAIEAAEMMAYIERFYVPGAGYRGTPEIERELAAQREASIRRIAEALRSYTKLEHGTNVEHWSIWARSEKGLTNGVRAPIP
jgi:hypothetical protein